MHRVQLALGSAASLFGVVTIFAGGSVLSGLVDGGRVVPLVLWFNFLVGFLYVVAGMGIARTRRWAPHLAGVIAAASVLVGVALLVYAAGGGAMEKRTAVAMTFRCAFWCVATWIAFRSAAPDVPKRAS